MRLSDEYRFQIFFCRLREITTACCIKIVIGNTWPVAVNETKVDDRPESSRIPIHFRFLP